VYEPDSIYTIVLSHSGNIISNFNSCVLRESDDMPAGTLQGGGNTTTYSHSGEGTAIHGSVNYRTSYTFDWKAPSAGTGTVVLFAAVHEGGAGGPNGVCALTSGESGVEEDEQKETDDPLFTVLNENPVSGVVHVALSSKKGTDLHVAVFDVRGRMVAILLDRWSGPGPSMVTWSPGKGSGLYFIVAKSADRTEVQKVIFLQ
jgi:hypothetical protein